MTTALARIEPQALISKALDNNAGIETLERLVALAKDVRAMEAREAWYHAMATFQRTCPTIKKTATAKINTARASYSYSYAPLHEILGTIQPVLGPLGLSISWRSRMEHHPDPRTIAPSVVVLCRVAHELGHHEDSGEIVMPITGEDGRGGNASQRAASAMTYAKRYSLLGIIGMAPEDDDDGGRNESGKDLAGGAPPDAADGAAPSDGSAPSASETGDERPDTAPARNILLGRIRAGFDRLQMNASQQTVAWEDAIPGVPFPTPDDRDTAASAEQLHDFLETLRARHKARPK